MVKEKKTSPEKEPLVLTEWQKRNIEFIEKKKSQAEEERKLKEKLLSEKKAQLQSKSNDEEIDTDGTSDTDSAKDEDDVKEEVIPKVKKEKTKRQKALIKASPVLLVSFLVLATSVFFLSPYSKLKTFASKGNDHTSLVELVNQSQIKPSEYFLSVFLSSAKHANAVKTSNPWVKDVSIHYQLPNHFVFDVKEYRIIAYAQVDNGFQPILENGRRVTIVNKSQLPKNFLIINLTKEKDIQYLVKALAKLPEDLVKMIKSISLANSNSTADLLTIEMQDGNTIRVPQSQLLKKMPYYLKIQKKLEGKTIVDMEVGIYSTTSDIEAKEADVKDEKKDNPEQKVETSDGTNASDQTSSSTNQPANPTNTPQPSESQPEANPSPEAVAPVPAQ
ncbi:cell division protein FtsQ/DivIB [Streptococcus porcinus]|uniref:Cell division protein DivIB n=1 Tax=Streptococcus porcinus str. Jelinkova 176 TaxID=873448 RepID=A0ABN0CU68_STRPO|nr:cell division protein FtsQ/DivIB [Streptococcus porcinus]EGJ26699.1 cell division protein FtsQ [Streptococcus porcinus str. Jelinkova 176]SQG43229.1 cell division protein [Streptococcus porcinus]VTT43785.1 cell division protein [Streptococcus porcinus]